MPSKYKLKLAHINDCHSHFDPSLVKFSIKHKNKNLELQTHSGGYARIGHQLAVAKQAAKQAKQNFVFLHAGDSFQGTLYFSKFQGQANAELLNLLSPDAMTLGNHEIDAGNEPVLKFLNNICFPLLAGNMDLSQECQNKRVKLANHRNLYDFDHEKKQAKVLFKPIGDKVLAIIGITLDQMKTIANPDVDTLFVNAIETLKNTIKELKSKGIDHIIVLSHLGLDKDKTLAQQVNGISAIVGGHSHSLQGNFTQLGLGNLPYGETINDTPIFHAGKNAESLGIVDLTFDDNGKVTALNGRNYFMLDADYELKSDQDITASDRQFVTDLIGSNPHIRNNEIDLRIEEVLANKYRPQLAELTQQLVGHASQDFIHTRLPSKSHPHGSEIAPWVSRSMYYEAIAANAHVDFALHNAGGVRQSVKQGDLNLAQIVGQLLPFAIPLVQYKIQGCYLIQMIESAINSATNNCVIGTGTGSFPYTYGLKYHYDGRQPKGQRIIKLKIMRPICQNGEKVWECIDKNRYYVGVSSSYTASGREGYDPILKADWLSVIKGLTLPNAFTRYMQKIQQLDGILPPLVHYTSHCLD